MSELEKAKQEIESLKQEIEHYKKVMKECNEINDQLTISLLEANKAVREYENMNKAKRLQNLFS